MPTFNIFCLPVLHKNVKYKPKLLIQMSKVGERVELHSMLNKSIPKERCSLQPNSTYRYKECWSRSPAWWICLPADQVKYQNQHGQTRIRIEGHHSAIKRKKRKKYVIKASCKVISNGKKGTLLVSQNSFLRIYKELGKATVQEKKESFSSALHYNLRKYSDLLYMAICSVKVNTSFLGGREWGGKKLNEVDKSNKKCKLKTTERISNHSWFALRNEKKTIKNNLWDRF